MANTKRNNEAARDVTPEAQAIVAKNIHEIDETYGDNLPYDAGRIVGEVKFYLHQGVMAMLQAGRRLIQLKEHESHGNFMKYVEENIGISHSVAKSMMRAARKFIGDNGEPNPKGRLVAHLDSVTKVYELAMMDDEDLEALEEGGTLAGKSLDDIQRMSPTELRKILRAEREERRQDAIAYSERIQKKEERITELEQANRKLLYPHSWEPEAERLSAEIDVVWMEGARLQNRIDYILGRLREIEPGEWDGAQFHLNQKLSGIAEELFQRFQSIRFYVQAGHVPTKLTFQMEDVEERAKILREEYAEHFSDEFVGYFPEPTEPDEE
ncbi:DUF3102 domain-containing protein [Sediminispirochaeta bajacaliforniensis]|uniref:DUF3102 domain-containing protein n=1 Tax=Sediminispirochaeta bajacaliforniensis TaxID=148 RepID=UPI000366843E|nr:DUF3102 domain-containing protein [Sediminispirochaeta bajacaliforniensis]